jgi:hypothetical protein
MTIDSKPSSFKLIREIPKDAPNSSVFHREVEWTTPTGTKQTYKKCIHIKDAEKIILIPM